MGPISFGFGGAQPAQMVAPQQPQQQAPQAQDPKSAYLAQALSSMGQQPPASGAALGSDLLATALDQYALQRQKQQQAMKGLNPNVIGDVSQGMIPDGSDPMAGLY